MRIAVVGAGGVGGYFGGRLAHAGIDTTFIVRNETLKALQQHGLRVESVTGDFVLPRVNATGDPESIGPVDAVLMTVKAWQLPEAAAQIGPLIGADTAVVPLENGVDSIEVLAPIVGREHVLGGLCAIVSYIVSPAHIRHPAFDPLAMFGELDNRRTPRAERLLAAFTSAGIKAEIPEDIHRSIWSKFLFITPMSAIGAITRVPIGVWRAQPEVRAVADHLLQEIASVAAARGHDLGTNAVERTWERYDAMAPESTASLQRDVIAGKPSELEAQLGAAVRIGREAEVATPVTELLYHCLLPQERLARENAGIK